MIFEEAVRSPAKDGLSPLDLFGVMCRLTKSFIRNIVELRRLQNSEKKVCHQKRATKLNWTFSFLS